jgi:hypothetical protein
MEILKYISDTTTAGIVIGLLLLLAIYGAVASKNHKLKHYAKQSPAILATVGIFFSFCGITYGLMGLDLSPEHIKDSIPNLLDGLKVKFIASLMGIGASIIVRVAQSFSIEEELAEVNVDDKIVNLLSDIHLVLAKNANNSPEELLQGLKQSIDELPAEFRKQTTLLDSIKSSLAGEGDASVTTQLGKLRSDMRDSLKDMDTSNKQRSEALNSTLTSNFDNLTQKFEDFAKIVAENNSKAFIEALEAAMRDFNNNITEQFGENFKQLNQAVGELLKWQENYKTHVETLTSNFETALNSVSTIQTAFTDIQTRSESFTQVSAELGVILQKLDAQLGDLNFHLKSLSQVADTAKEAFPIIEGNLEKLTLGFKKSTEQSLTDINSTVESVGDDLKETVSRLRDTTGKLRDSMEGQRETLETTSNEFKSTVDATLKSLSRETQASIHTYQDSLQEAVSSQLSVIDSNIKQSNTVVSNTIQTASEAFEKSIAETGVALKASTNTVAQHLTEATDSMKDMIEQHQTTLSSTSAEFKSVVNQTLTDMSRETQASIHTYQDSLQEAVSSQLSAIDNTIQKSSDVVNASIDNMSRTLEKTIDQTASTLETSTKKVASHLTDATSSMKDMIAAQKETLASTGTEFKNVVNQTLRDLSKETQDSIRNYQDSLQEVVKRQLNSIDDSIKETHSVVNKTIQNVGAEFEKAIKNQSESMNKTIATAGESFKSVIQETAKEFEVMAETIAESINTQEQTLKNVSQDVKVAIDKTLRELTEQSKASAKEYETSLHNIIMSQFNTVKDSVNAASKDFNRLLAENTDKSASALQQAMMQMDKDLQAALKNAIETMGKHLATLSNQFVQDYRPLTERLKEVVKIAEDLKRGR